MRAAVLQRPFQINVENVSRYMEFIFKLARVQSIDQRRKPDGVFT
jgi:hypothetical protein